MEFLTNPSSCPVATDDHGRELISHGTVAFPIACYHDDLSTNPVNWHWHEEFELVLIIDGVATAAADGRRYSLPKGSGCFINSGVLHSLDTDDSSCSFHSLVFHPRLVGGTMDSIFWQKLIQPLLNSRSGSVIPLNLLTEGHERILCFIESVWTLCNASSPGYESDVRYQLTQLLDHLSHHIPSSEDIPTEKDLRDSERIKLMLQFIQDHYAEDLTLGQISASAMISESEALRCFHNTIETTPIQYLKDYRLRKAAELLSSSRGKVSDIAVQCGFQEMSYFARSFRQKYGITPSQYRTH